MLKNRVLLEAGWCHVKEYFANEVVMIRVIFLLGLIWLGMMKGEALTSFEEGMGAGYDPRRYANAKKLKKYYERAHFENTPYHDVPQIPKKIHQIWIGGDVPQKFKQWMRTWQEKHPEWEYKLWTDQDIDGFSFLYPETFFRAKNLGAKSDIWRYEILYQQGGVYVDVDFEAIKAFDVLVHHHPFFVGIGGFDYINNAVIGSKPQHPLLHKLLKILCAMPTSHFEMPWYHTGPLFFTKQVYAYLKEHPDQGTVYPIRFFYPLPNEYRFAHRRGELSEEMIRSFFIPETFAVHYWAESWKE